MEKSLSLGFYCSNYLHCCFLASRSIIHQKIAVTYFWSSYLLWLGILFEIKRQLFARCSLFVIFEKSHRNWGTKSVTREGVGSDQWLCFNMFQVKIHSALLKVFHSAFGSSPKKFLATLHEACVVWIPKRLRMIANSKYTEKIIVY